MSMDDLLARAATVSDTHLAELSLGPPPAPGLSRRRRRTLAAGIGLSCAVALGAPAAAGVLNARTGVVAQGGEDGHGEMLRMDAPDVREVYEQHLSDVPLPPGGSWDALLARVTDPEREPMVMAESGVAQDVAYEAHCQWERAWLRGEPTAQKMLEQIPRWPGITSGDPADGGEGGLPYALARIAEAAGRGDAGPLKQDLRVNCP
jgi:hypothetical protein